MSRNGRIVTILLLAVGSAAPVMARTAWAPVGQGTLQIVNANLQAPARSSARPSTPRVRAVAPLKHTDVQIKMRGFVAEVTVTQEFVNPLGRAIEAVYIFPLPDESAVNAMEMRIGRRIIRGKIERRQAARQQYEQARDQCKRAALLEQERPNIFTQSVANIAPGETIRVVIRYVQALPYKDGAYEIVFPMVVAPRYIPAHGGGGQIVKGNQPDAMLISSDGLADGVAPATRPATTTSATPINRRRITPKILPAGRRCGHDISLSVDIDAGVPISKLTSRAHKVTTARDGEAGATVKLDRGDSVPNKDFVLNVATAGDQPEIGLLAHHNGKSGYFTLLLQPPNAPAAEQIRPREVILLLDVSGSMSGRPIDLSKRAAVKVLQSLRPTDRFNIISFAGAAHTYRRAPVTATPVEVGKAIKHVRHRLRAGGGTEMLKGLRAALNQPKPDEMLRVFVFLSDGFIGNEIEILAEVKANVGTSRFFSFGVGSSVNRYLLERMATLGHGRCEIILLNDDPVKTIQRFVDRMKAPVLTDVEVKVNGVEVFDCLPSHVPDLYAGLPVYAHGRYRAGGKATVEILGRIGPARTSSKMSVTFPGPSKASSPLPSIWARQRIKQLEMDKLGSGDASAIEEQITQVALEYSLMSQYTSFVAIDETPTGLTGSPDRQDVDVPLADGYERGASDPTSTPPASPTPVPPALVSPVPVGPMQAPPPVGSQYTRGSAYQSGPGPVSVGGTGGGPIGPIGLGILGVLAAGEVLRRRRRSAK